MCLVFGLDAVAAFGNYFTRGLNVCVNVGDFLFSDWNGVGSVLFADADEIMKKALCELAATARLTYFLRVIFMGFCLESKTSKISIEPEFLLK